MSLAFLFFFFLKFNMQYECLFYIPSTTGGYVHTALQLATYEIYGLMLLLGPKMKFGLQPVASVCVHVKRY